MEFKSVHDIIDQAIENGSSDLSIVGQYLYELPYEINDHLTNCNNLSYLTMNSCRLTNIKNLTLYQLKDLSLSDNLLVDEQIQIIQKFEQLKYLDLSGNNIKSVGSLRFIEILPNLISLEVEGNPFCDEQKDYQEFLFKVNKNLQSIDGYDKNGFAVDINRSYDTEDQSDEYEDDEGFIEEEQDLEDIEMVIEDQLIQMFNALQKKLYFVFLQVYHIF